MKKKLSITNQTKTDNKIYNIPLNKTVFYNTVVRPCGVKN